MKLEVTTTTVITYDPTNNIESTSFMVMKEKFLEAGMDLVTITKPPFCGNNIQVQFRKTEVSTNENE